MEIKLDAGKVIVEMEQAEYNRLMYVLGIATADSRVASNGEVRRFINEMVNKNAAMEQAQG